MQHRQSLPPVDTGGRILPDLRGSFYDLQQLEQTLAQHRQASQEPQQDPQDQDIQASHTIQQHEPLQQTQQSESTEPLQPIQPNQWLHPNRQLAQDPQPSSQPRSTRWEGIPSQQPQSAPQQQLASNNPYRDRNYLTGSNNDIPAPEVQEETRENRQSNDDQLDLSLLHPAMRPQRHETEQPRQESYVSHHDAEGAVHDDNRRERTEAVRRRPSSSLYSRYSDSIRRYNEEQLGDHMCQQREALLDEPPTHANPQIAPMPGGPPTHSGQLQSPKADAPLPSVEQDHQRRNYNNAFNLYQGLGRTRQHPQRQDHGERVPTWERFCRWLAAETLPQHEQEEARRRRRTVDSQGNLIDMRNHGVAREIPTHDAPLSGNNNGNLRRGSVIRQGEVIWDGDDVPPANTQTNDPTRRRSWFSRMMETYGSTAGDFPTFGIRNRGNGQSPPSAQNEGDAQDGDHAQTISGNQNNANAQPLGGNEARRSFWSRFRTRACRRD